MQLLTFALSMSRAGVGTSASARRRALYVTRSTEPILLVGSPECAASRVLQSPGAPMRGSAEWHKQWAMSVEHLEFCTLLYG